ncbi:GNAT family N-acetyltransferase [Fictibacillus nanhaiensis]|uniref:GNAT family N-acetyltransferase n=1 Tax=Fictibacillus nanhaiensis TaxID=742169 RepID=UPI001C96828B|nr:GNAT family N-acetyltransferase [Fictibacillus nanhaiensis]MBY6036548.1 GNAT family N-acetyltransferase [Fictibacillus nanhaiensis]
MISEHVKLVEVNAENWYDCCKLEVSEDQKKYLEPNAISIAQSKYEPTLKPWAIYYEEKVVGFLMYNTVQEELDGYWVYRIMVDQEYQGKGIGKVATKLMLAEMAKLANANRIVVGYHPSNVGAHQLYASLGFIDYGNRFGKEMAVIKDIKG